MKLQNIIFVVAMAALLFACSKSDEETQEHFLSGQQRALEQAKNVNNVIQQADEKQRKLLEEMER